MKDLLQVFTFFAMDDVFHLEFSGYVGTMQCSLCIGIFFHLHTGFDNAEALHILITDKR